MSLKIYNTLSRKKEKFVPLKKGKVSMYICGVTVYDDCHLGHARAYVAFDVIYRYLEYKGYKVKYVQNFTDVDDKVINRAREELKKIKNHPEKFREFPGLSPRNLSKIPEGKSKIKIEEDALKEKVKEISQRYINAYFEVMDKLNIKRATKYPKATKSIRDMIEMIEGLIDKGFAYEVNGSVYFAVDKFKSYGKLSRRPRDEITNISRIDKDKNKKNPLDFALWKKSKPDEPAWPNPWGEGRPGWHIECSVMSQKNLGETLDIHGGGSDLIFPHHENEIAQSEAYTGNPFVRYWLHNGFVTIDKEKMSKSLGNIFALKDIFEKYNPEVIRLFLISTHYRSPIDFSLERLEETKRKWERISICLERRPSPLPKKKISHPETEKLISRFEECMDDDFNTAGAIGVLFELVGMINKGFDKDKPDEKLINSGYQALNRMLEVLGLPNKVSRKTDKEVEDLIRQREEARQAKNWALSDKIRNDLKEKGVILEDSKEETKWRRI